MLNQSFSSQMTSSTLCKAQFSEANSSVTFSSERLVPAIFIMHEAVLESNSSTFILTLVTPLIFIKVRATKSTPG